MSINLLTAADMAPYGTEYQQAFLVPLPSPPAGKALALPTLPSAIDTAAGFAIDFVAAQLQQEATEYEAQFKQTVVGDQFWVSDPTPQTVRTLKTETKTVTTTEKTAIAEGASLKLKPPITQTVQTTVDDSSASQFTNLVQNYCGFEIVRKVAISSSLASSTKQEQEAFRLVIGIAPSRDQNMFRMAPLVFEEDYTKAKVLSDQWFTWLEIWTWPGKLIKTPGHTIDSTSTITVTAYWRDKDQQLQVKQIAGFTVAVNGYDVDNPKTLTPSTGLLGKESAAWLPAVPVSIDAQGNSVGLGTFTISALVDDKDASNTQQYLEQASDLIVKEKPTLLQLIPSGTPQKTGTGK